MPVSDEGRSWPGQQDWRQDSFRAHCQLPFPGPCTQHRGPQEPEDGRPHIQVLLAERQPLNAEPKTHRGARGAGALSGAEPGKCLA